jgi:hypothetical protein
MANSWKQDVSKMLLEGGRVETIVDAGGGVYYIGGEFVAVGGVLAKNIAKWNGTAWEAMGQGLGENGGVLDIAVVSGTEVYAGGDFYSFAGLSYFARWNGTAWSAVSTFDQTVQALKLVGSDLYVGGNFSSINGTAALGYFAKRSGTVWSSMGTFNANVYGITNEGTNLYVGGSFSSISGSVTGNVAKWNGTIWSKMGTPPDYAVRAMTAVSASEIYIGGHFTQAGGSSAEKVAKWDGAQWRPLGSGVNNNVIALTRVGGDLYVGGQFTQAGGSAASKVARWNGTQWSPLGNGVALSSDYAVTALGQVGSELFVGGNFVRVDGSNLQASGLAKYGTAWQEVSPVTKLGSVRDIYDAGSGICYVGGSFTYIGTMTANHIAKWNGSTFEALGAGVTGTDYQAGVKAITMLNGDLYVGGHFNKAGGSDALRVARWNGTQWHPLAGGVTGPFNSHIVYGMDVLGSNVYVGGSFTQVNGSAATSFAWWNGSQWFSGPSIPEVYVVRAIGSEIYVGGNLSINGGTNNYLAKWNGSQLLAVANGNFSAVIRTIEQVGSDVYVGGTFERGGDAGTQIYHPYLLRLVNGTSWQTPVGGVAGAVEISEATCVANSSYSLANKYFLFSIADSTGSVTDYYAWYDPSMGMDAPPAVDPAISGRSGISIMLYDGNHTANDVASFTASSIDSYISPTGGSATNPSGALVRIIGGGTGDVTNITAGTSGFSVSVATQGASGTKVVDGYVNALTSVGSDIYVGGEFFYAMGSSFAANKIVKLQGTTWSALGNGIPNTYDVVFAVDGVGDNVFVGGVFSNVDGTIPASGIALWEGPDTTAPIVGNSGVITKANVTGTSLDLNWTKATDSVSVQSQLQYLAYYSLNSAMNSVANIEANGTAVGFYTVNINTKSIADLTSGSTYYFNVIVKDEAGNKAAYTQVSQTFDATNPTVGNSGIITKTNVTGTSLDLNWTKATDDVTAQANLQYLAYYSLNSSMTSVANIEANGTAVGTYTADINTKPISGLTSGSTYYFNVIVKDEVGNKAAYAQVSQDLDGTAPVVGNSGIITTSGVGQTGVTLNWTKATDAVSAQANLQYLAYYSTSSTFDSVSEVEAGTAVGTYTADINTKPVTGLTVETTYYFNVIGKDEVGNKAVYAKKMQATSAAETTVIDGDNATVGDGETVTWGSLAGGLTLTAKGEVLSGGEVILQLTSLDDLTGIAYFIEVKPGASLTFSGETIIPKSGTVYRLRPRT